MFRVNYRFARPMLMDADTGVEVPSGAESAADSGTNNEPQGDAGAADPVETQPDDRTEKAFAARFAKEREKLEREYAEKYRDYDLYKGIGEYFREANQYDDPRQLLEEIELARLQERAEQSNISPEMQRRLEELEAKAAKAEEYEQQQELRTWYANFQKELETFASDKGTDAKALEQYMAENKISNMDIAYKAMSFQDAKAEREKIEAEAVKKYLESKRAPRAEGSGAVGHVPPAAPKTWEQSRASAIARLRSINQPQ